MRVAQNNAHGYGLYIVIEHATFCTLYAHLSAFNVKVGSKVRQGDKIGYMGSTGRSSATHLHFEIRPVPYSLFWQRQTIYGDSKPLYMVDPLLWLEGEL